MASSLHACHSSFRSWTGLILTYHSLKYVHKYVFCQLCYFNNHASIPPLTGNALTTPAPISTNTDFRQTGYSLSAICKALLCWILQVVTQEWSQWSSTLWSKFSVKMTYLCLNCQIGCASALDIVWCGREGSRNFTTWTHRAITTWSDSYCFNVNWQWQCKQYRLTVTTYYNLEWQWLLQHGVTVTVTT